MGKVLVIDDEEYMGWIIKKALAPCGFDISLATSGKSGLNLAEKENPDLVILDIRMPDIDGIEVLKRIKKIQSDTQVIIITAHGSIDTAILSMKQGAFDYITKPFDVDELIMQCKKAMDIGRLKNEVDYLRQEVSGNINEIELKSKNVVMTDIYETIKKISQSTATVLITGESGTGKEVAARAIHKLSDRKNKAFIPINCAAIPENLLESELFGYEKGAFTGAVQKKLGKFELAQDGTIFLDEIGEMSLQMQVKLLRVLQEKEIQRVGGTVNIKVDARIIAATNRDLKREIEEGKFREDLYYRLNVVPIELPPLRQRKEDIPDLIKHFLKKYDVQGTINGVSDEAMELLISYNWPGNIRELENVIERMAILNKESTISPENLPREIQSSKSSENDNIVNFPKEGINLEDVERNLITKSLEMSHGNQTRAAELLGITRSALIYRMQKNNIK